LIPSFFFLAKPVPLVFPALFSFSFQPIPSGGPIPLRARAFLVKLRFFFFMLCVDTRRFASPRGKPVARLRSFLLLIPFSKPRSVFFFLRFFFLFSLFFFFNFHVLLPSFALRRTASLCLDSDFKFAATPFLLFFFVFLYPPLFFCPVPVGVSAFFLTELLERGSPFAFVF